MREFNLEERNIINFINNVFERTKLPIAFEAIVMSFCLTNKNLVIDFDIKTAFLKIDKDLYNEGGSTLLVAEIRNFNRIIITTINIIKGLQKYGLIVSYYETQPMLKGRHEYGNLIHVNGKEKDSINAVIYDTDTIEALINFSHKSIMGNNQLSDFVKRGYISIEENRRQKEELRQKKDLKIAVYALVVAVILGVFDLGIGLIELCHTSHEVHLLHKIYCILKWSYFK